MTQGFCLRRIEPCSPGAEQPLRYFLVILRGVFLEGDTSSVLLPYYWPMIIIALFTLSLAGWLFRHRMN